MRKGYNLSRLSLTPACLPPRAEGRVGGSDSTTPPQARPGADQTTLKGPPSPRSGSGGLSLVDGANPPHFLAVPAPTARPRSLLLASFARLPAPRYTRKRSLSSLHADNTARLADGYCRLYSFWVGGCFTVMLPLSTCTNGRSSQPSFCFSRQTQVATCSLFSLMFPISCLPAPVQRGKVFRFDSTSRRCSKARSLGGYFQDHRILPLHWRGKRSRLSWASRLILSQITNKFHRRGSQSSQHQEPKTGEGGVGWGCLRVTSTARESTTPPVTERCYRR